jgi:hypothetical protein
MVTTVLLFLFTVLVVGVIATPGLGAFGLMVAPLVGVGVVWWIGLAATTHGHPSDAVVRTKHREFLGPGGPDDPFAGEEVDERSTR